MVEFHLPNFLAKLFEAIIMLLKWLYVELIISPSSILNTTYFCVRRLIIESFSWDIPSWVASCTCQIFIFCQDGIFQGWVWIVRCWSINYTWLNKYLWIFNVYLLTIDWYSCMFIEYWYSCMLHVFPLNVHN